MESLTEEEVFDILDGLAPSNLIEKHENLLKISKDYALTFNELSDSHRLLSSQITLEPSVNFTSNLLANISFANNTAEEKSSARFPLFAMVAILIFMIIFSGYLISLYGHELIGAKYFPNINWISSKFTKQIVLIINGLMLLWLIDKLVIKKLMNRMLDVEN